MIEVLTSTQRFDKDILAAEVSLARSVSTFSDGPYGNCISLPDAEDLWEPFRSHRNNVPFSGALSQCSYMREIFDSFLTEKAAFRLLRRRRKTAYALHDDKDKGPDVLRFQIPIVTDENAFLLLTREGIDLADFESQAARMNDDDASDIRFDLEKLDEVLGGQFDLFSLRVGQLYYFDTDIVHTLINAGDNERIVLSFDLIVNDWLRQWMQGNLTQEVSPSSVQRASSIDWEWNALRHGVIRNP